MRFANEETDLSELMKSAMERDAFLSLQKEQQRLRELMRLRSDKVVDRTVGGVDINAKALGFDGTQPVEAYAF